MGETSPKRDIGGLRPSKMPMSRVIENMDVVDDVDAVEPDWCPFLPVNAECVFTRLSVKPCDRCLQAQIRYELNQLRKALDRLRVTH